jgi:MFS family permease
MAAAPHVHTRRPALTGSQWTLLSLLVLSICINYIDRGSLSVGQSYVTRDLNIDPKQLGMIFSAFFWTYAPMQILAGWLVDRWNVNIVYGVGFLLWSLAMLLTGFANGLPALLFLRILLGAGESVAYPSYSRILAAGYREDQRGLANSLIDAGSKLGPALGVLIGGLLMETFGWRMFFIGLGSASLLWLLPWYRFAPGASRATFRQENVPTLGRILRERSAWGTFLGLVCGNYAWYFMVFWLPPYFLNERHFSQHDMSILGSVPFWGVATVSIFGGWISDRFICRGYSPNVVRKTMVISGLLLSTSMVPAMLVRDNMISLTLLTLACASYGLFASNIWAVTQTLAGPTAAGKWTGIQNAIGNIPGMFGLWFTGWIIEETGQFFYAFLVACGFLIVGALSYLFIVGKLVEVNWAEKS